MPSNSAKNYPSTEKTPPREDYLPALKNTTVAVSRISVKIVVRMKKCLRWVEEATEVDEQHKYFSRVPVQV